MEDTAFTLTYKINKLRLWDKNPRNIKEKDFKRLKKQIKELGQYKPLLITADGEVLGGNMRLRAYRDLGIENVWVSVVNPKNEAEKLKYALSDNDRAGYYDDDLLANVTSDYPDFEWDDYAVDLNPPTTLDDILKNDEVVEDEPPEVSEGKPKSKLGEVYKLGRHRLMCGDSTKMEDVEKLMDGKKAKCLFTSPPYNMSGDMYETYTDNLKSQEYIDFNLEVVRTWVPFMKGYLFWNISYNKNSRWEFLEIASRILKESGLRFMELIVWNKKHALPITSKDMLTRQYEDIFMMGDEDVIAQEMELFWLGTTEKRGYFNKKKGKGITNYWEIGTLDSQLKNHEACYPVGLPARGIRLTTQEDDIVIDPFGGSGTTLIACEQLDRTCYMMELDPAYCDVIRKRYEQFKEAN